MSHRLLAALLTLPLLAACGEEAYPIDPPGQQQLPAGDFIAADLPAPFGPDDQLRVSFEKGQVSFQATCNTLSGNASLEDDVLVVSSVGGTEMGCMGAGHEQDEWLVDFFTSRPTLDTIDVGFSLQGESAELLLLPPEAVPGEDDVSLEGTDWRLTGIEETDGDAVGMTPAPRRLKASLRIDGGELSFFDGCNAGGGDVKVLQDRLLLRRVAVELKGCSGIRQQVEDAQLPVLMAKWADWSVDGDQLRLSRGPTTLLYRATP